MGECHLRWQNEESKPKRMGAEQNINRNQKLVLRIAFFFQVKSRKNTGQEGKIKQKRDT